MASHNTEFRATNSGVQVGHNSGNITFETGVDSEKAQNRQCLQHLRSALGTDPRDHKSRTERVKGGLLRDAYIWVLSHPDYQQWHDNPSCRLLWIKGDAGKGKTMILCGLIDELSDSIAESAILSYSFCQSFNAELNSALSALLGLIYLLVDQIPTLISHVRNRYDQTGDQLFKDVKSWDTLARVFTNILEDPILKGAYLFIDALDECLIDQPLLLDLISKLSSKYSHIKWIVTSRNEPEIEDRLYHAAEKVKLSLELSEESVSRAVTTFIHFKVDDLSKQKRCKPEVRQAISNHLLSNSQGTFLWVSLVCGELSTEVAWKARSLLTRFPRGLEPLYRSMMDRILQSEDSILYKQILSTILVAYRPLSLDEFINMTDLPDDLSDGDDEALLGIISGCRSFLTIRGRTVLFIHSSAKEFLMTWEADNIFRVGVEAEHYALFQRSTMAFQTLKRDIYELKLPSIHIDDVRRPDLNPLAEVEYSCLYWVDHLEACHGTRIAHHEFQKNGSVNRFFRSNLLLWFEALSLLGSVSQGISAIVKLIDLLQTVDEASDTLNLVHDALRFIRYFGHAIERWPLQIYISPLFFSPVQSITRLNYHTDLPEWALSIFGTRASWDLSSILVLEGHRGNVSALAWSPDELRLASASSDLTIRIWDTHTGECLSVLYGYNKNADSIEWSPNGTRLVSGSDDNSVKVWNTFTAECIATFRGHCSPILSVVWLKDLNQFVSESQKEFRVWDLTTNKCVGVSKFKQDMEDSRGSFFSPDGHRVAVRDSFSSVNICDLVTNRFVRIPGPSRDPGIQSSRPFILSSLAWSPDGTKVALLGANEGGKICDSTTGDCLFSPPRLGEPAHSWDHVIVTTCQWSPDGRQIIILDSNETFRTWCLDTGEITKTPIKTMDRQYSSFIGPFEKVALSHGGNRLAVYDTVLPRIRVWNTSSGELIWDLQGHTDGIVSLQWPQHEKILASGSEDSTVRIWDLTTTPKALMQRHAGNVHIIKWSPDGNQVLTSSFSGIIRIWDSTSGKCTLILDAQGLIPSSISWSHDGRRLASSFWTRNKYPTFPSRLILSEKDLSDNATYANIDDFDFDSDGLTVRSLCSQGPVALIWDPRNGKPVSIPRSTGWEFKGKYQSVAWSSDNRKLALCKFGYSDYEIEIGVWDITTSQFLAITPCKLPGMVSIPSVFMSDCSMAWSKDGDRISISCPNNSVQILRLANGQLTHEATVDHTDAGRRVISTSWSRNGTRLASQSTDGTVTVWDTKSWQILFRLNIPSKIHGEDFLHFHPTSSDHLVFGIGTFDLRTITPIFQSVNTPPPLPSVPAYSIDDDWVTYGREKVIWLPPEYRTKVWANSGTSLALGCESGDFLIFNFAPME